MSYLHVHHFHSLLFSSLHLPKSSRRRNITRSKENSTNSLIALMKFATIYCLLLVWIRKIDYCWGLLYTITYVYLIFFYKIFFKICINKQNYVLQQMLFYSYAGDGITALFFLEKQTVTEILCHWKIRTKC